MRRTPEEEAAAAAYYEQHMDDSDMWEEVPEPPSTGGRAVSITGPFGVADDAGAYAPQFQARRIAGQPQTRGMAAEGEPGVAP